MDTANRYQKRVPGNWYDPDRVPVFSLVIQADRHYFCPDRPRRPECGDHGHTIAAGIQSSNLVAH